MTSTNDVISQKATWYQINILSKCFSGLAEQFDSYRYFVKIMLSYSKWRLSRQINEIEQNDVTIDVISQKCDMVSINDFVKVFLRSH